MAKFDIDTAVLKLNTLLPLHERQSLLLPEAKKVHQSILNDFATRGGVQPGYNKEILLLLDKYDLVVLDKTLGEVTGAYPFSLRKTLHRVEIGNFSVYAMCAIDAIAIAPVFNLAVCIKSQCHITNDKIEINQQGTKVNYIKGSQDLYLGIHWQDAGSCAAESLCMEMIFLRDKKTAELWLNSAPDKSVFSFTDALEFATRYFKPLTVIN